jgi:hypothetical protein
MSHDPLAAYLAVQLTREHANSAMPDAPVIPYRPRRRPLRALRATMAADLHRVASWLEPAERCPAPVQQR